MSSNVYVRPYRLLAFTKTCLCDYPHVRERLSRAQSTTIGNTGERRRWWWKRGASPIRMRLISPAELITFPESSQTSGHAHRSCGLQSKSIKEKSLYWNNHKCGFMARCQRQICDPFKTCVSVSHYINFRDTEEYRIRLT